MFRGYLHNDLRWLLRLDPEQWEPLSYNDTIGRGKLGPYDYRRLWDVEYWRYKRNESLALTSVVYGIRRFRPNDWVECRKMCEQALSTIKTDTARWRTAVRKIERDAYGDPNKPRPHYLRYSEIYTKTKTLRAAWTEPTPWVVVSCLVRDISTKFPCPFGMTGRTDKIPWYGEVAEDV